jgi:hypothetical protein
MIFMILLGVYTYLANTVDETTNPEKYDALKKKRYTFGISCFSFLGVALAVGYGGKVSGVL